MFHCILALVEKVSKIGYIKPETKFYFIFLKNAPEMFFFLNNFHIYIRVQRVPVTGNKSDRLQTSTCSVAFLPQPRELKIELADSDIKFEYMRSSGAGGQSVNTTDSACRLTHFPSG